jgi:hypothetical protein
MFFPYGSTEQHLGPLCNAVDHAGLLLDQSHSRTLQRWRFVEKNESDQVEPRSLHRFTGS